MKFRTSILLVMVSLLVAVVAAAVLVIATTIEGGAREAVEVETARSAAALVDLQEYQASLHRVQAQVVAQEPRLKAVVNTRDIDHATVLDSARELQQSVGSDLFILTDGSGSLRADTADPEAEGFDLGGNPTVAAALASGEAAGVWVDERRAYQVHAWRLAIADEVIGALVLGFAIDTWLTDAVARQSASEVVITMGGRPLAATSMATVPGGVEAALPGLLALGEARTPTALRIGEEAFLTVGGAFPGSRADQELRFYVVRSLDRALASSRAGVRLLLGVAALALALAIGLALRLAGRLSAPLDRLVEFTRSIAGGSLEPRRGLAGPVEITALGEAMNRMVVELAESREQVRAKQRLEDELEIATRIQTSILPTRLAVPGYELAAAMVPATEVGGDYYDVLPVADGCWLGVGDVAGHGLRAGLVMLMVQSCVAGLVRERPAGRPRELVATLNTILHDNIRHRLHQDEHVTFTLFRCRVDGHLEFAGAHEDVLIARASGEVEEVATPGTWVGVIDAIDVALVDTSLALAPGEVVVLYTDGLIEARNAAGERLGLGRVRDAVAGCRGAPVEAIRDALMALWRGWVATQEDDVSVVVLRYVGAPAPTA